MQQWFAERDAHNPDSGPPRSIVVTNVQDVPVVRVSRRVSIVPDVRRQGRFKNSRFKVQS